MPLRKSPVRTATLLAANRASARKCTGPSTFQGKARASLNALKHGRNATHLRRKLLEAGDQQGEALYRRIEARVAEAFSTGSADEEPQLRRLTSLVWCFSVRCRRLPAGPSLKTKPECPSDSGGNTLRTVPRTRIQVNDSYRRIGLIFWMQRRRLPGWNRFWRQFGNGFERMGTGVGQIQVPEAGLGLEGGLRSRIFRLRRPGIWERLRYGLDRDGSYSPKLEERGRRELKKLCLAGIPVSLCPPLLGSLFGTDQTPSSGFDWSLIPFGFEKLP